MVKGDNDHSFGVAGCAGLQPARDTA